MTLYYGRIMVVNNLQQYALAQQHEQSREIIINFSGFLKHACVLFLLLCRRQAWLSYEENQTETLKCDNSLGRTTLIEAYFPMTSFAPFLSLQKMFKSCVVSVVKYTIITPNAALCQIQYNYFNVSLTKFARKPIYHLLKDNMLV